MAQLRQTGQAKQWNNYPVSLNGQKVEEYSKAKIKKTGTGYQPGDSEDEPGWEYVNGFPCVRYW